MSNQQLYKLKYRLALHTWLEYLVIWTVSHIEAAQLDSNLIASGLAHCEGHFDYIGLWFLQNLLRNRDVQSQFNVGDVDPQSHRSMGWERLAILIEQLSRQTHKGSIIQYRGHTSQFYISEHRFPDKYHCCVQKQLLRKSITLETKGTEHP